MTTSKLTKENYEKYIFIKKTCPEGATWHLIHLHSKNIKEKIFSLKSRK